MKHIVTFIVIVAFSIAFFTFNVEASDKGKKEYEVAYQMLNTVVQGDISGILNAMPKLRHLGKFSKSNRLSLLLYNFEFEMPWTTIKNVSINAMSSVLIFNPKVLVAVHSPEASQNLFEEFHETWHRTLADSEVEDFGPAARYFKPSFIKETFRTCQKFFESVLMTNLNHISKENPPGKNLYLVNLLILKSTLTQMPKSNSSWDIIYKYHFPETKTYCYQFSKRDLSLNEIVVINANDEKLELLIISKLINGITQADIDVVLNSFNKT